MSRVSPAPWIHRFVAFALAIIHATNSSGQIGSVAEIPKLETSDRISLQQIDQLIDAADWDGAVTEIIRLSDNASSRLIEVKLDGAQQVTERWVPLDIFLADRLMRWSVSHPQLLTHYREQTDRLAKAAIEQARGELSLEKAIQLVREYFATSYGDDAMLLVADLAIDRGWSDLARASISRIDSRLQASGIGHATVSVVPAVSWNHLLAMHETQETAIAEQIIRDDRGLPFGCYMNTDLPIGEVALRLPYASLLAGDLQRAQREMALCRELFGHENEATQYATLDRMLDKHGEERPLEIAFGHSPQWTAPLNAISPDGARHTSYVPAVWSGRVLVHDINRIVGYDLDSGRSWPIGKPTELESREETSLENSATPSMPIPIFESGQPVDEVLPPANLPIVGRPTFSLEAFGDRLVARLGPPVTGWLPVVRKPPGSASQVAVFDLHQEGKLLDAYPAALQSPKLSGYEVEGTPILIGDRLIFGVTRRDSSLYTSRVLCIDLRTGTQLWESETLSVNSMLIDHSANRVTHASVTHRQGTLYYHAALGTAAALDAATGRIQWLVRYPRGEDSANPYRQSRQSRRQIITPIQLDAESALLAAADCDRLISIDATSGHVLWASSPELGQSTEHILGATDKHWIVSGQRLYWIDRHTGRVDAAFSADSSHVFGGGISSPHSIGRGIIAEGRIFWPTTEEILVFDERLLNSNDGLCPQLRDRIDLRAIGLTGGNLLIENRHLILVNNERLAVFEREPLAAE